MSRPGLALPDDGLAARDVRVGGRWTAAQSLKNSVIAGGLHAGIHLADRLPPRWLLAFGQAAGRVAGLTLRRSRAMAQANLEAAIGPEHARELARQCFISAGENLMLCLLLRRSWISTGELVEVDDASKRTLLDALGEGPGTIMIGAHLGPFEWMAAAVSDLGHRPAVVVRESYDPRLDGLVNEHREQRGVETIPRGNPAAVRRIVRTLREGRPVGFLPDLGGRVEQSPAEICGLATTIAAGPQKLAARMGTPVVFGALQPRPTQGALPKFRLCIRRIRGGSEAEMTQRISNALSDALREHPSQWLWMARRLSLPIAEF